VQDHCHPGTAIAIERHTPDGNTTGCTTPTGKHICLGNTLVVTGCSFRQCAKVVLRHGQHQHGHSAANPCRQQHWWHFPCRHFPLHFPRQHPFSANGCASRHPRSLRTCQVQGLADWASYQPEEARPNTNTKRAKQTPKSGLEPRIFSQILEYHSSLSYQR
jgi:hypothetical protein